MDKQLLVYGGGFVLHLGRRPRRPWGAPFPDTTGEKHDRLLLVSGEEAGPFPLAGVACGAGANVAVGGGRPWGWGEATYGELLGVEQQGLGNEQADGSLDKEEQHYQHLPVPLRLLDEKVRMSVVAMGPHHVMCALESGGLLAWGLDLRGQGLGLEHCGHCRLCASQHVSPARQGVAVPRPRRVPMLEGRQIVALATGDGHSLCLTSEGELLSWGMGSSGQLGQGPPPSAAGAEGRPSVEGDLSSCRPMPVHWDGTADPISQVAVGKSHSMLLTRGGRVATFGSSLYHQLGHGTTSSEWVPRVVASLEGIGEMLPGGEFSGIKAIACSGWHSVALSTTGEVYGWGWNKFGQLGSGGQGLLPTPHLLPQVSVIVKTSTGTSNGRPEEHEDEVLFDQVGAGHRYTAALSRRHGLLYYWGSTGLVSMDGVEARAASVAGTAVDLGTSNIKVVSSGGMEVGSGGLGQDEVDALAALRGEGGGTRTAVVAEGLACGPWHLLVYGSRHKQ